MSRDTLNQSLDKFPAVTCGKIIRKSIMRYEILHLICPKRVFKTLLKLTIKNPTELTINLGPAITLKAEAEYRIPPALKLFILQRG